MSKVTQYACDGCTGIYPDLTQFAIILDVTKSQIVNLKRDTYHFCGLSCLNDWCFRLAHRRNPEPLT